MERNFLFISLTKILMQFNAKISHENFKTINNDTLPSFVSFKLAKS